MRCKNCGWENQDGSTRCVKCNSPLSGSSVAPGMQNYEGYQGGHSERPLSGTVKEGEVFSSVKNSPLETPMSSASSCPRCGYPTRSDMNTCPNCGASLKSAQQPAPQKNEAPSAKCAKCGTPYRPGEKFCSNCGAPLRMGTVNNWANPSQGVFCTLKPIAWANEGIDHQPQSYSGDVIVLNRANTDPNNNSITSQEQAALINDGSNWYIENRSQQETTYIKVRKKTKLESGDVIILGNRMFEFKG